MESIVMFLCVLNCLSWTHGVNESNTTSSPSNDGPSNDVVIPKRHTEWEKHALVNLMIVAMVVLVIVGGVFVIRYMRTEKKNTLRRYARLSKADDDDDIELSIYEKK